MAQTASDIEVPRIDNPTREELFSFVDRNRPVVMTGVVPTWPAFEKWGPDYLKEVAGDASVNVHFEEDGNFQRWYTPTGQKDLEMTLGEFIDILQREPADRRYYMTEHDMTLISQQLVDDLDASRYSDGEPRIFLGRDTCMPLHYHATTEAILCQIIGHKEVLLYSPEQFPLLYAHSWNSPAWMFSRISGPQQIDAFTTDTKHLQIDPKTDDQFPRFQHAQPTVIKLAPGEILLIPVHWWHLTTCPGFQVNCTFFWRSQSKRYTFPQPGVQVLAHEWMNKIRQLTRPGRAS